MPMPSLNSFIFKLLPTCLAGAFLFVTASASSQTAQNTVDLAFVGDAMVPTQLQKDMAKHPEGFYALMQPIQSALTADLSFVNIETPVGVPRSDKEVDVLNAKQRWSNQTPYSGFPFFNVHPQYLASLRKAGFTGGQLANNHMLDRATRGAEITLKNVKDAGLISYGLRQSGTKEYPVGFFNVIKNDRVYQIAVISCAFSTNGLPDPNKLVPLCFENDSKEVLAAVRKESADPKNALVIFTPHWGSEYARSHNRLQENLAKRVIEAGAGAIIGTHPHVLQEYTVMRNKTNQPIPVAYSLGNFFNWSLSNEGTSSSVVLHLEFEPIVTNTAIKLVFKKGSAVPIAADRHRSKQLHPRALSFVCDTKTWALDFASILKSFRKETLDFSHCLQPNSKVF